MEILDTAEGMAPAAAPDQESHISIDRFEMTRRFAERDEEEKVEAAMALYEKAARARMPSDGPDILDSAETEEELEARSQELKLRQKCLDIAARILVDEQDLMDDDSDED